MIPLLNFPFCQTGPWPEDMAWEEPCKGTESLPEGGSGGEPHGRY